MNAKLDTDDSTLSAYMRRMSSFDLMTAEEEAAAAAAIAGLRTERWRCILAHEPVRAAVTELARASLGEATSAAGAEQLADADEDGALAERIVAELGAIHDGAARPELAALPEMERDDAFRAYVADVRRASRRLVSACRRFAEANLRLVVYVARQFGRGALPLEDLVQEGNIGLMKAIDRFDHRRGCRFSTYAIWWIRHSMGRAIADLARTVRVPVHTQSAFGKVARARSKIEATYGRKGSNAELAAATGLSEASIERMTEVVLHRAVSLDQEVAEGRALVDMLADDSSPAPTRLLEDEATQSRVRQALDRLRPMEADILRRRFGLGGGSKLTCAELGKHYSLSRERVRQVQAEALKKIRRELRDLDLR